MSAAVEVREVDPLEVRDAVVDLLWEHRHWPGESRADYARLWEWRYRHLGDGPPRVWVARGEGESVVGHYALFPRRFRHGDRTLCGAVAGDLLVHRDHRGAPLAILLARVPLRLTRSGELDLVIVTATPAAHALAVGIGYRDLGRMDRHVDVRDSRADLGRRFPLAAPLAPVLDLGLGALRSLRRRGLAALAARFRVDVLDAEAVAGLALEDWSAPADRLVTAPSAGHLAGRFLGDPYHRRLAFGLTDRERGRVEGAVILEISGRTGGVQACRVNAAVLDEARAIALVGAHLPTDLDRCSVPTLADSELSRELRALGFFQRRSGADEPPRILLGGAWAPDHPLAAELGSTPRWNLYSGVADA